MPIKQEGSDTRPEPALNMVNDRHDDREAAAAILLAVGPEDETQIIARGMYAERRVNLIEMDDRHLAQSLAKLADYGSQAEHVSELLRVAAARLIQSSVPRDQWKKHIPEGSVLDHWRLIEFRSFGSVARYTIYWNNSIITRRSSEEKDPAIVQILMINNAGILLERQQVVESEVGRYVNNLESWIRDKSQVRY